MSSFTRTERRTTVTTEVLWRPDHGDKTTTKTVVVTQYKVEVEAAYPLSEARYRRDSAVPLYRPSAVVVEHDGTTTGVAVIGNRVLKSGALSPNNSVIHSLGTYMNRDKRPDWLREVIADALAVAVAP